MPLSVSTCGYVDKGFLARSTICLSGNLLGQVLVFHALRKADECLLLVRSSELIEIRNKLSRLFDAGNKPAEVSAA